MQEIFDTESGMRSTILEEATRLFGQHGVASVSVRDIAEAANMSAPNLYAHFRKGRDQLVTEIFRMGYAFYAQRLQNILENSDNCKERLDMMLREICYLHNENENMFKFLIINQYEHLQEVSRTQSNPVEILQSLLKEGVDKGEFKLPDGGGVEMLTAAIVGLIVQTATFRLYGRIQQSLLQKADTIVSLGLKIVS